MRKLLLILLAVSACTLSAQQKNGTFSIMPKTFVNIHNYNEDGCKSQIGIGAGFCLDYQISQRLGLSCEIQYSPQGAKEKGHIKEGQYIGEPYTLIYKTNYLNIPVLANIYIIKGLSINLGIQPSFNIKADYKLKGLGQTVKGSLSSLDIFVETFDFSIPVGVTYEKNNIALNCRYNFGITSIFKEAQSQAKNQVIQIGIGYKIVL